MSEQNRNPDEIEEKTVELPEGWSDADFVNEDEPAVEAELAPEAPENPETPEAPSPEAPVEPPAPRVPPLLADVSDPAERKKLIEDAIESLPADERATLRGVDEIVRTVRTIGQREGETNALTQSQQQQQLEQLDEAASTFIDRAKQYGASPEFKWDEELSNVQRLAGDHRQGEFVGAMSKGVGEAFKQFGVTSFPQELIQRVEAANSFDQVIGHYVQYAVAIGAEGGKAIQKGEYERQSEADHIALKARSKNEALGELAQNGRIRISRDAEGLFAELVNDTAPPIDGGVPSGAVTVDEAEWELAQRDPDAYDRLMANPGKRAFIENLTAEAVGGRR